MDGNSQSVWVEIVKAKEKLIFGVIYRPPNAADGVNTALFQEISRVARYRMYASVAILIMRGLTELTS